MSFLGSVVDAFSGRSQQKRSLGFQREMAKKAHQYEVEDLRSAGLNPILSGTGGPGARASGGAAAPATNFASTAVATRRLNQELENMKAQKDKIDAETVGVKLENETRALDAYIAGGKLSVLRETLSKLGLDPSEIAAKIKAIELPVRVIPFGKGYSDYEHGSVHSPGGPRRKNQNKNKFKPTGYESP